MGENREAVERVVLRRLCDHSRNAQDTDPRALTRRLGSYGGRLFGAAEGLAISQSVALGFRLLRLWRILRSLPQKGSGGDS